MIRILHAADLHLDSPFAAMPPQKAKQRRIEQREVLSRLVSVCSERNCDLLLLAGDLFDSDEIYRETTELLIRLLGSCSAKVFISPGNHDCCSPASVYNTLSWPENVHIFRSEQLEAVHLDQITVYGAAFTEPHASKLMRGFRAEHNGKPSVMVLHGELSERDGLYNSISRADVAGSGLDYLALGHIHEDNLCRIGTTTVGNPGCAMGRGFDELGEKGAFYVELSESGCSVQPVPLGAKEYQICRAVIQDDLAQGIAEAIPQEAGNMIVRLILTGSCPAPDLAALHQVLDPRFDTLEIIDRTLPPRTLWEGAGEDSLKGLFLQRLQDLYNKAGDDDRLTVALAARLGRDLMEGREVTAE